MWRHLTLGVGPRLHVSSCGCALRNSRRTLELPDPQSLLTSPTGLFAALSGRQGHPAAGVAPTPIEQDGGRRGRRRGICFSKPYNVGSCGGGSGAGTHPGMRRTDARPWTFFNREAASLALMILILTAVWEALNSQKENISRKLREMFFLTLEVRSSREEFAMILDWMGRQPQGRRARNISLMPISIRDEVPEEGKLRDGADSGGDFVPGFGSHYMKFGRTRLWITRSLDNSKQHKSASRMDREDEILQLVFFSRDRRVVHEFMEEVRASAEEQSKSTVRLYLPNGWGTRWEFLAKRLRRPLSTLYLPRSTMATVEEAKLFLRSRELYMSLGVPWRRGYLFEGAPGTGKTSFILGLASELSLPIYLLSLQSKELDDASLIGLINSVPPRSLLVIEDLETAIKAPSITSSPQQCALSTEVGGGREAGVSLSALLNAIDGIASSEGRLLIITANDASRLPSPDALLRPGRVDRRVSFGPLDPDGMKEMVRSFQSRSAEPSLQGAFARWKHEDSGTAAPTTPAELQNELLSSIYKNELSH
ncbi:putative ATP-dependent chaperone [Trypanosoma conorhini]|uniref:Putative ATP-dependent chaperone n=1 Tax=Trypanosoma conorhini TaxID=83891 RepID=A0A422QA77_9TRYP|nr:putative ATP-dependent chaperone [Trypanosoma conorhini]RNF26870.1 putative ATP-dependent chaperone [Trypanosoma conorhini]